MEANREAAMQCLSIATSAWALDDITKALKFAQKSHDLFPGTASDAIIRNAKLCEANRHAAEQMTAISKGRSSMPRRVDICALQSLQLR
jgi:hypothetical protein